MTTPELHPPTKVRVDRLSRDLREAAATMTELEARYLVDAYYIMQGDRKRAHNQVRAMEGEPHTVIAWLADNSQFLEKEIKTALERFALGRPVGRWLMGNYGIGPVISAGLISYVDFAKCPTAGHIWRFAGLDPTVTWEKGKKRPWNASLKTLCWNIGQSFMKFSGREDCYYGKLYLERKAYEVERNERGGNAEYAKLMLERKNYSKATDAYKHLTSGKLPPAQIDARARRWAVKMFLSHFHEVGYFLHHGTHAPAPYPVTHMGHVHNIRPPNLDQVPGF